MVDYYNKWSLAIYFCPCFQVNVSAYDLGEPTSNRITGQITVTIRRNNFPPEILNLYHEMNISENRAVNANTNPVFTVQARDNDTVVSEIQCT